jgi:hypothetical protein
MRRGCPGIRLPTLLVTRHHYLLTYPTPLALPLGGISMNRNKKDKTVNYHNSF